MTVQDNPAPLILFVDDEATAVKYFQRAMDSLAPVITAGSVEEGKRVLDEHAPSLMVLVSDQRMPGGYGNELLHYASMQYPHMVRILTTAYSELERTVEAVNEGQIHRYIQKPWEIAALRVEMKQALDLAALRKEHAQLLREKMTVRQQQLLSGRIGALHALCASLVGPDNFLPLEMYLSAAATVGVKSPEPDWLLMDYAELVSAEAQRSGRFGYDVRNRLAEIGQRYKDWQPADGPDLLRELLGDGMRVSADGAVTVADAKSLAEFLEAAPDAPVSVQHASWLALLLWLHDKGCTLQVSKQDGGMSCRLENALAPIPIERLGYWMGRFMENGEGRCG